MKKLFFILLLVMLPSLVFSQGIGKRNLILSAGLNFPTGGTEFRDDHKPSYDIDLQFEWTIGKKLALGFDLNHGKFPTKITASQQNPIPNGDYNYTSILIFGKLQNNLAKEKDFQFFLKGGAGVFLITGSGNGRDLMHGWSNTSGGLAILTGAGMNYFFQRGDKFILETGYRYNPGSDTNYNSVYINTGISFCVNFSDK